MELLAAEPRDVHRAREGHLGSGVAAMLLRPAVRGVAAAKAAGVLRSWPPRFLPGFLS
jgi:hypothetical protein